jgi:predicted tellurium resistance membrane protein TerC
LFAFGWKPMIDPNELLTANGLVSLLTLTLMEVVLGIDNIIFIALVSAKLPRHQQSRARGIGLSVALLFRVVLLFSISWIIGLKDPWFFIGAFGVTGRDLILFSGGIFLIIKTSMEIWEKIFHSSKIHASGSDALSLRSAILQIIFLDVVFSFDSILTAVGLIRNVFIMVVAVVISMLVMLAFSGGVSDFMNRHPTVKMLALAFLIAIGFMLVAESLHVHVEKSLVYTALAFSLAVEFLNMAYRSQAHKRNKP